MAKIPNFPQKESKISDIVCDKFPHLNFSKRRSYFSPAPIPEHLKNVPEHAWHEELKKKEDYQLELDNYSEEKIDELYEPIRIKNTEKRNSEIERAENLLFNKPSLKANHEFWNKVDYWTPEEFVALSFDKDPKSITKKYVEAGQFGGMYLSEFAILQFPIKYLERLELLERSLAEKNVNNASIENIRMKPQNCIKWAKDKKIKLPDELLSFYDAPTKQIKGSSMTELPKNLHYNVKKVIKYIDDQLDQSCGDEINISIDMFGNNPHYLFEGFEMTGGNNLNFSNTSEKMSEILLKMEQEFALILIQDRVKNMLGDIYNFKIKVSKDFKSRTRHLFETNSSQDGVNLEIEKLKLQLQEKENEIEKLKKEKPLGISEKKSLLRMIYGMAIGGYGWKPESAKNSATSDITDDINKNCYKQITDDTVRKWLKEAKQIAGLED